MEIVEAKQQSITKSFDHYFEQFETRANEWMEKVKEINVTDVSQVEMIEKSKEGLKIIKQVEKGIDSKHKDLKEEALRTGQILDSIKRRLKAIVEPVKTHLQNNVDFVEIQEQKRKDALRAEREGLLRPLIGEQVSLLQLGEMDEGMFQTLYKGQLAAKEQKQIEEAEAAKEREKAEKDAADERERIRQENEKLKKENEEKEALRNKWSGRVNLLTPFGMVWNADSQSYVNGDFNVSLVEIKTDTDEQFSAKCLSISNEVSKRREKELREKERQKKKLDDEKALRKEAEDKLKELEAEEKRKEAEAKKMKRAPDRTKLKSMAEQIKLLPRPDLKEEDSKVILRNVEVLLAKVIKYIDEQTESL